MFENGLLIGNQFNILWLSLLIALMLQNIAWMLQFKYRNADFVDVAWSFGVVIVSLLYLIENPRSSSLTAILVLAPSLWYLRLAIHLVLRFDFEKEDGRYSYLRQHWYKENGLLVAQLKFYLFFVFQAFLIWFFCLPVYLILQHSGEMPWALMVAVVLLLISFTGVTISDFQLSKFKQEKTGEVCNVGLWKYSRHPNYFFEWLHWLAYPLLGLSNNSLANEYWWLIASYPMWMFLFLWKFTGIPYNEQQNLRTKGDKYRQYQQTTNAFFPGKPRQSIHLNKESL